MIFNAYHLRNITYLDTSSYDVILSNVGYLLAHTISENLTISSGDLLCTNSNRNYTLLPRYVVLLDTEVSEYHTP
jgi:hypothetical protein